MATEYHPGTGPVIRGVMVLELNIKLGGMQPMNLYEVAYVDGGGQTMGRVRCNVVTPAAQKKLDAFIEQLEADFIEVSSTELHDPESLMEPQEDGLAYPSP
tara:strand:+ start:607 stop:909 length:303 start_codon:yes stop_codon:yes gene_type:complete